MNTDKNWDTEYPFHQNQAKGFANRVTFSTPWIFKMIIQIPYHCPLWVCPITLLVLPLHCHALIWSALILNMSVHAPTTSISSFVQGPCRVYQICLIAVVYSTVSCNLPLPSSMTTPEVCAWGVKWMLPLEHSIPPSPVLCTLTSVLITIYCSIRRIEFLSTLPNIRYFLDLLVLSFKGIWLIFITSLMLNCSIFWLLEN